MDQHVPEHREGVPHSPTRAGQVDDQAGADDAGHTAREHGGVHVPVHAIGTQRLGDPRDLEVQQLEGDLRGAVGRGQAGAARGDDQAGPTIDGRPDRLAHRSPVGYDDRRADLEVELAQLLDDHRPGLVLVDPGRGAVGRDDDLGGESGHWQIIS
jgi:hypothetical protein